MHSKHADLNLEARPGVSGTGSLPARLAWGDFEARAREVGLGGLQGADGLALLYHEILLCIKRAPDACWGADGPEHGAVQARIGPAPCGAASRCLSRAAQTVRFYGQL